MDPLGPEGHKLDPRSIKCVFLGYSRTQKGYQCYSPTLCRHFISVDVTLGVRLDTLILLKIENIIAK